MSKKLPAKPGTPWGGIAAIASSLLYGVSPIDLLPDLIPLVGLMDDAVAVPLLFLWGVMLIVRVRRGTMEQVPARVTPHQGEIIDVEPQIPDSYDRVAR